MTAVEVSPQSWEYRLVAAVVRAVEKRAAAGRADRRSRWNGRVLEEDDPENLGSAHADGSLSVSVEHVLVPLRRARDLDRPLTDDEAWMVRDAMDTLTHEAAHLMASPGDTTAPDAYPYDDAAVAFDEGRVEHWTQRNLAKVVADVFTDAGLDKVRNAVLQQSSIDAYATFTPAVRELDAALAERTGLTGAEVNRELICADDSQRWNVAVDLVIDEKLARTGLMPESDRAEVRRQLVAPLRGALANLVAVEDDDTLEATEKAAAGVQAAQQAITGLDRELKRIEAGYRTGQLLGLPDFKRLHSLTDAQAPATGATRQPGEVDRAPTRPDDGSRQRSTQRPAVPPGPGIG